MKRRTIRKEQIIETYEILQAAHALMELWPVAVEYVPAAQLVNVDTPAAQYAPAGHVVRADALAGQ